MSTREVYRNRWMTVREDEIRRPDGSTGIYSVVDKPDFALVIPAEPDGFHLVEQYRYPVGGRYWEFPQGTAAGGAAADARPTLARAELAEETGLRAGLAGAARPPALRVRDEQPGLRRVPGHRADPGAAGAGGSEQDMRQRRVSRAEFEQLIRSGRVTDDSTLAAYALLLMREAGRL